MYINLGNTNINYSTNLDDYIIVSEVVDSQLSYENPVLVRTKDELDIWFGKDFSDRNYFDELLQSGVTLYLYKPILSSNIRDKNYINLDTYTKDPEHYYNFDEIKHPQSEVIYIVNNEEYIYLDEDWISVDLLPQNIDNISSSLDNRDTLFIDRLGNTCHPEFSYSDFNLGVYTEDLDYNDLNYKDDYTDFNNDTETIAFRIKSSTPSLGPGYIIIQNAQEYNPYFGKGYLCFGPGTTIDDEEVNNSCYNSWHYDEPILQFTDLINIYVSLGYSCKKISDLEYLIYTKNAYITKLTHFYTFKEITIENEFQINNNIIYNTMKDKPCFKFWSKSIGTCDEPVKIKIETVKDDITRITLGRYDYYEVFEGPLYPEENEERIDSAISKYSKLVYCEFIPVTLKPEYNLESQGTYVECDEFRLDGITGTVNIKTKRLDRKHYALNINSGELNQIIKVSELKNFGFTNREFELKGGIEENVESFDKGLECMFDSNKTNVYPDFILVPDKYKYSGDSIFLPIAEEYNLQVLLENNEEDFSDNLDDKNNRLIYFYNPMQINYRKRPGYYLHLLGILGNIFSMSSKYIIYNTPEEDLKPGLEKYKSNYLVFNNHQYFYKKYLSGDDYNCTVWMRFVLGKIERELNKNRGYFLTQRHMGQVKNAVEGILRKIVSRFSIVKSITLIKFIPELTKNYLSLGIKTEINDLVDKDVTINLTINI